MLESQMRQKVVKLLKPLHAVSVENGGCHPGTPDIDYAGGNIELKATEQWPARRDTVVKLRHPMTQQQKVWHVKRHAAGGKTWVLLTIAGDWLLFRGEVAARVLGLGTRKDFFRNAVDFWDCMPDFEELRWYLVDDNQS